jgi:hypothetical protein
MTQTQSLSAMPAIPWIYYRYISHDLDQRVFGFFFFAFSLFSSLARLLQVFI